MKIDEQLIRRIVIETLEKSGEAEEADPAQSGPPTGASTDAKSVAVAFSASASAKAAETIQLLTKSGCAVRSVGCAARAPESLYDAVRKRGVEPVCGCEPRPLCDSSDAVAAPELSLGDAAKLTRSILDDLPAEWIWNALADGKPVYAAPGDGFQSRLPAPLARAAEEVRRGCEQMGVQWAAPGEIHLIASAELSSEARGATLHIPNSSKPPLITEATIAGLRRGVKAVAAPSNAVVTPLARDLAKKRGILIQARP